MPAELEIELPRNASVLRQWAFADDAGVPIDLSGAAFDLDVKAAAGDADVIASATVTLEDGPGGIVHVRFDGPDFDDVAGATEVVRLAFDFNVTQDGLTIRVASGQVVLLPGVSE